MHAAQLSAVSVVPVGSEEGGFGNCAPPGRCGRVPDAGV